MRVTGAPQRRLELITRVAGVTALQATASLPPGDDPVVLQVESWPDRYEFSYKTVAGDNAPATRIGVAATAPLTSELAGGFTGVFIGMYAEGAGKNKPMPPADFAWFDYQAIEK